MLVSPILVEVLKSVEGEGDATFVAEGPRISSSSGKSYYGKVGSPLSIPQFHGEAESLKAIQQAAPGLCPTFIASGIGTSPADSDDDDTEEDATVPYLISTYIFLTPLSKSTAVVLAKRMAMELHTARSPNGKFGFGCPTYCGVTVVQNRWQDTWPAAFKSMIGGLLDQLEKKGDFVQVCTLGTDVMDRLIWAEITTRVIPYLLDPLQIEPVLLHGDLWSGNVGTNALTGEPIVYDPASYYGHNEADLSIARMFGGFPAEFFEEYHRHRSKTEPVAQYESRQTLYELFHYLNHTTIFGGSYAGGAITRMRSLIALVDGVDKT